MAESHENTHQLSPTERSFIADETSANARALNLIRHMKPAILRVADVVTHKGGATVKQLYGCAEVPLQEDASGNKGSFSAVLFAAWGIEIPRSYSFKGPLQTTATCELVLSATPLGAQDAQWRFIRPPFQLTGNIDGSLHNGFLPDKNYGVILSPEFREVANDPSQREVQAEYGRWLGLMETVVIGESPQAGPTAK